MIFDSGSVKFRCVFGAGTASSGLVRCWRRGASLETSWQRHYPSKTTCTPGTTKSTFRPFPFRLCESKIGRSCGLFSHISSQDLRRLKHGPGSCRQFRHDVQRELIGTFAFASRSGKDFSRNIAVNVGQSQISSAVTPRQMCVIQTEQMQQRGV